MKKVRFLGLACLMVMLIGSIAGCAQQTPTVAQPTTLVFSFHDPDTNNQNVGIYQPWFNMIEQRTGGKVKFECHYNGELVSVMDAYDSVAKGTVDIAVILPSTLAQFPLDEIVASPAFDTMAWRPSRVYNELYQKYPEFQAEYSQVKLLLLYCMSPGNLGTTKKPVKTLEDCAGLKVITADPYQSERAKALGQIPVSCPPPEFYTTLEKGIADGGDVVTLPEMITYKWADVIKNITLLPFLQMDSAVIMNKQKWDSLPADVKKVIDDSIPEAIDLADKSQILAYKDALARLPKEFGTNIITLSPSELARFVQADNPVRDKFVADLSAKGLPAKQIYDDYTSLSKKYSAPEYEINP